MTTPAIPPQAAAPEGAPPKPNRRQQAKARTRQRVLDAAAARFEACGYVGATIRDIAKDAGMSTGALFANFRDKDELWSAVTGGPAPNLNVADEVARLEGACPGATWVVSCNGGHDFAAVLAPSAGGILKVKAASLAAVLRLAREAAEAAQASARLGEAA